MVHYVELCIQERHNFLYNSDHGRENDATSHSRTLVATTDRISGIRFIYVKV